MFRILLRKILFSWWFLLVLPLYVSGQDNSVNTLSQQFTNYSKATLQEKIYVHTDRSSYLTGETLWFKMYYVDGFHHKPLNVSKVAYLEITDKEHTPVLQTKIALTDGSGNGSVFLPASLSSGNYIVRAYTNWMKNFSPDFYFEKPITIINTFRQLGLPQLEDSTSYDIQFFPEGGNLISNLPGKVAFRATDKNGKGVNIQGAVLSSENDTVATFQSKRFGIGHFSFTPQSGKAYRAIMQVANKRIISNLPVTYNEGYSLQLEDFGAEQLTISVRAKLLADAASSSYVYLLGHTRQSIKIAQRQTLQQNKAVFVIDKKLLGEGISHFTVFDASNRPVCERLYFKKPLSPLVIEVTPENNQVSTRKKTSLTIATHLQSGTPVSADMSLAIYKIDSLQNHPDATLFNYLWLTSDLAGTIESPEYYFTANTPEVNEAADNLMLTHGWRRFKWEDIFSKDSTAFAFIPEYGGHLIGGKVVSVKKDMPVNNITAYLSVPGRQGKLYLSRSSESGAVQFELKNLYGNKQVVAQTNFQQDSLFRIELFSPYSQQRSATKLPDFMLAEQLKDQVQERSISMQTQNTYFAERRNQYAANKTDTTAFYGVPDAAYNLDDYTRFPLMEDVLREYVPGVQARKRRGKFYLEVLDLPHKINFTDNPLVLVDGIPVFDMDKIMAYDPLKVKRLEVVNRRYFLGPLTFSGILSYSTYRGDFTDLALDANSIIVDYDGLQMQREFYAPVYDTPQRSESRLPDYRHLLYWAPSVQTNKQGKHTLEFYTSDLQGEYVIVIQGITKNGEAGYGTATFTIQNPIK